MERLVRCFFPPVKEGLADIVDAHLDSDGDGSGDGDSLLLLQQGLVESLRRQRLRLLAVGQGENAADVGLLRPDGQPDGLC